MSAPRATKGTSLKELTLRGIIIGGIITLVFTAANVYLGLKVGLTFATSIPAAVISMAVLRFWGDHTVQENNIVQTIASAAGTLSAVIFVLPGLVIVGWWSGFPYWETMFVCAVGGALGVMYSIPLRRALVTGANGQLGRELMRALPERSDELVRIVLLLDALPTAEMEVLTPKDLPSIQWLRAHRAHAGGVALVRACAAAGMPLAGVEALQAQTEGFARTVVREGAVAALLSDVEALPTASEYASTTTWLARVR